MKAKPKTIYVIQNKKTIYYRSTVKAFTFIELFIVIIIIGILIGISLPSFKKTFNNLQLNSFSQEIQAFMNYLHERSIVEGKIIYFNIDNEKKEYWAKIKDTKARLRTYFLPRGIDIEIIKKADTDNKQIIFYPDGQIDKVSIKIAGPDKQGIILTTEGMFGKIKIQPQE